MSTIICDVDGVLADLHVAWLNAYNAKMGTSFKPSDIKDWGFTGMDINKEVLFAILWEPTLYDSVPLIHEADLAIRCLRLMGHRVVFATSSTDVSAGAKMRWLKKYGFIEGTGLNQFKDVVIIHDKSLLARAGDIMIDDHAGNFRGFEGVKILFDHPHNRSLVEDGFVRLYGWGAVVNYILRLV